MYVYIWVYATCVQLPTETGRDYFPLELELQAVVSHLIKVLRIKLWSWKSSKCSWPQNHLSSTRFYILFPKFLVNFSLNQEVCKSGNSYDRHRSCSWYCLCSEFGKIVPYPGNSNQRCKNFHIKTCEVSWRKIRNLFESRCSFRLSFFVEDRRGAGLRTASSGEHSISPFGVRM